MDKDIQAYFRMEKELVRRYRGRYAVFYNGKPAAIEKKLNKALEKARKKTGAREFFVHPLYSFKEQANAIL